MSDIYLILEKLSFKNYLFRFVVATFKLNYQIYTYIEYFVSVDLGCGHGTINITAAKKYAVPGLGKAYGVK